MRVLACSRRAALGGAAGLAGVLALDACASSRAPASSRPTEVPGAIRAASGATGPVGRGQATLRLAHWWARLISPVIPLIEAKYNVKIVEESVGFGEYRDKLLTQFAGGAAPDLLMLDNSAVGPFWTRGLLRPLDEALKTRKIEPDKWAIDLDDYAGYRGRIQGLPMFLGFPVGWAINTDLIERAALDIPHRWPFWGTPEFDDFSWEKLIENFAACTKRLSDGKVETYGDTTSWHGFSMAQQVGIFENGGELFDSYDFDEKVTRINSPEAIEVIQRTVDLVVSHRVAPPMGGEQAFKEGLWNAQKGVAKFSWFSYNIFGSPEERGFNWRWISMPHVGRGRRVLKTTNLVSVNPRSTSGDLALDVAVTLATDVDFTAALFPTWWNIPAYNPGAYLAAIKDPHKAEAMNVYLARYPAFSRCRRCGENNKLVPGHLGRSAGFVANTLTTQIQGVLAGEKSVPRAMDLAKQLIDAELART